MFYFIYSITEYFVQKGCIKLIKSDRKEITISTKNAISNQSGSFRKFCSSKASKNRIMVSTKILSNTVAFTTVKLKGGVSEWRQG